MTFRSETLAEGIVLYLGDCREVLPTLAADAIVTDPPYGIGYVHGAENIPHATRFSGQAVIGDDEAFDPTPWLKFPQSLFWGANHFARLLPGGGRWLIWDKRDGTGDGKAMSDVEMAWLSGPRHADRIFRQLWDGFNKDGERGVPRVHPTQKPIRLMEWCIGFISGQTILDPYMGSGTTGVAAVRTGRRFIGVEIDPAHFETACARVSAALKQGDLFIEHPKPKQEAMPI